MFYNFLNLGLINFLVYFSFSFLFSFYGIKYFIILLKKHNKFQPIREEGPTNHLITKAKTPTMGGAIISISLIIGILLFCNLKLSSILITICLIFTFSIIGLLDDLIKVFFNNTKGFQGSKKLILQLLITSICMLYLGYSNYEYLNSGVILPLFDVEIPLGNLILTFYTFIICGSSNAANITDGLDGLLSVPIIIISTTLFIITLLLMNNYHSLYIIQPSYDLLYNILIILILIITIFSTFMIYNHHPAKIFMGDVGSLMIGAVLCYISILLKIEILYGIMSFLFIFEISSTIIQIAYFKLTKGKRIFKMAPFHHHLEKCGWSENKIVFSMWIFTFICCAFSLGLFLI